MRGPLRRRARARSGMSMIEVSVALVLLAVVLGKIVLALRMSGEHQQQVAAEEVVEDHAQRVLERIAYALMGADRDSLLPVPAEGLPFSTVDYQISLGLVGGEVVWEDPERIAQPGETLTVEWRQNPEQVEERRLVWTNLVRGYLEGELRNGVDDNGNGLVDEKGLAFVIQGNTIWIQLTLERTDRHGKPFLRTVERRVTLRNPGEGA